MNFLFSSLLCSNRLLSYLQENAKIKPTYSVQKFFRLIAIGLIKNNSKVSTITSIPFSKKSINRLVFNIKSESENHIHFHYAFSVNLPLLKNICVFINSLIYTLFWALKNKTGVILCDTLQVSVCLGSLLASKITGRDCIAIITDMPGYGAYNKGISLISKFMMLYINSFNKYILITKEMNELVNKKKKPYLIIEGLVDYKMESGKNITDNQKKIILYAGGLYKKYGVKMLTDAFIKLKNKSAELHLYGKGDMVQYIQQKTKSNKNIIYYGVMDNKIIVNDELKAFLLVNPRYTSEKLTRYSFPSKNMEYMVSGTPVLTTNLSGMPEEYKKYVYLINDETVEGLTKSFEHILKLPGEEVIKKGLNAKKFVLENKNNIIQTKKILDFLNK